METNDPRVRTEVVDGQVLYFPTPEAWEELEKYPVFGGNKIPVTDIIFPKVKWTSSFNELQSAFGFAFGNQLFFYELLELDGIKIRVFIERIICDHCGKRAEISAMVGAPESYWGSEDKQAAREKGYSYPNLACPYCRKIFKGDGRFGVSSENQSFAITSNFGQ